jgi:hypothetical protein
MNGNCIPEEASPWPTAFALCLHAYAGAGRVHPDNDCSEQAARKYRELCEGNDWLASKRGTYDQMVRPEVRDAYQKEMDLLVGRIYELNQPKKHTFRLRKLT